MLFFSNRFCMLFLGLLPILLGSSILLWWGRRWLVLLWLGCCVIFPGRWTVASDGGRVVTPRCGVASVLSITSLWLLCSRVIAAYGGCIVTSPSGGIVTSLSGRIVTSLSGRFVASVSTIPSTQRSYNPTTQR